MKMSEIKQKIVDFLKEDSEEYPHEKFNFRQSLQGKLATIVIGFATMLVLIQAIPPSLLTEVIISPQNGFTILSLFPLVLMGYTTVMGAEIMGNWIIDKFMIIANDVKERVSLPTYISDSLVLIVVFGYVAVKIFFPGVLGGIR